MCNSCSNLQLGSSPRNDPLIHRCCSPRHRPQASHSPFWSRLETPLCRLRLVRTVCAYLRLCLAVQAAAHGRLLRPGERRVGQRLAMTAVTVTEASRRRHSHPSPSLSAEYALAKALAGTPPQGAHRRTSMAFEASNPMTAAPAKERVMRSPKKGREPMRLQDLANAIHCIQCDQDKPATGARRFHACHVCSDCAQKLSRLPATPTSTMQSAH